MKCEKDDVEVFINDSVKLVETAEHKTYIADTRLNGAEIIDLGVVMTDEESSDDFEEEPQKTTQPPTDMTSPSRRKERSPSVEIIDLDRYEPKDKTDTVLDKTVDTKETKSKNAFNKSIDNSDDEIEIFDVLNRTKENASKGRKKRLSYEEEKIQAFQQRKENKPFDIKKNQGFVGMKVIRSSAIIKQNSNKCNIESKSISKERKRKKRRVRDPKEKRLQNLKVTEEILSEIKKQETQIQKKKTVDSINTRKIKHYAISKLLEIKNNLIQDLGKLDYKLDINKNILKPSKAVKNVSDNKTPITNAVTSKDHQRVSQKKMLAQSSAFENKESLKTISQNKKDVTSYIYDIQKKEKSDSSKPKKVISIQEPKKEQRNIDKENTKKELLKPKTIISVKEYKKAQQNIDTTKKYTLQHKENGKEINKSAICQNDSLEVTSELKIKNIDTRISVEEHNKQKINIDTTIEDTVQRQEISKEVNKSITKKNDSMSITSELQNKRIDNRVNVEDNQKKKGNIDITNKDTIQRKEDKEITKSTYSQNNCIKITSELQNKSIDSKVNVEKNRNEKGNIDTIKKDIIQREEDIKYIKKSTSIQNNSIRVTSELQKNKIGNIINLETEKEIINTAKTDTVRSKEESKDNTSSRSQNSFRVTSEPQRKDPTDRLKLIKPDYLTITKTKHKNKSVRICPIPNNYTETIKERVRKLRQRANKAFESVFNKNPPDQSVQSYAVSLAHEVHSQKDSKATLTTKSLEPEDIEAPNVSINVNYTSDNKITIEIVNTSPKMPKLLASDQQVQKQQVAGLLSTNITPKPQVSQILAKPVAAKPSAPDLRVSHPQVYPPVSMPLLFDPIRSDLDPSVTKRPASDPQVTNPPVSTPITPPSQLRTLQIPPNYSPSKPLVPNKIVSNPRTYNFQEPNPQILNNIHASNSQITNPQGLNVLPDLVASNASVSKTPTPDSRKSKLHVADPPTTKPLSLDPLVPNQQLSKPLAPMSQVYNPREPKPPKSHASYSPVAVSQSLMPPLVPDPPVQNQPVQNQPVQKPPVLKPLVPDPLLKLAPKSKSTPQPVDTQEMIEKAVLEYKLGQYYAHHQQQMQMNAKDTAYVNNPTDYTRKTVRLASMPHPPSTDFKNKKPLKILSVEDIDNLYTHKQTDYMRNEQLESIALQNISKMVQNVPAMPKKLPIQRLVNHRTYTIHNTRHKTTVPSNYYNPATPAARIYTEQIANHPGTNDPRLGLQTYAAYVPYCQNMPCMPAESQLNFPTQQNVSMYQQPNSYLPYNDQYYPSDMHNYLQSFGYMVPNQTAYNAGMGVPMCDPGRLPPPPPPPPYPTQPPIPKTIPSKENESIIGKNNDGVIKKINITSPYRDVWCKNIQPYESPKQEVKENKTNLKKCEDKDKEKIISTSPVSTKSEMQKVLDNFILDNFILDTNSTSDNAILDNSMKVDKKNASVIDIRTGLKRSHENSASNEEKVRSRPCPLSKKIKPNDPVNAPEQSRDQINKNTGYSPPILPIPPNYENHFSMPKSLETKSGSGEKKSPLAITSEGLANLLQLSNKDLSQILQKSGYKTKRMN